MGFAYVWCVSPSNMGMYGVLIVVFFPEFGKGNPLVSSYACCEKGGCQARQLPTIFAVHLLAVEQRHPDAVKHWLHWP